MEAIIWWSILGVTVLGTGGWAFFEVRMARRKPRTLDPWIRSEIQAELDQTPEWWDREFRKLGGSFGPVDDLAHNLAVLGRSGQYQLFKEVAQYYSPAAWARAVEGRIVGDDPGIKTYGTPAAVVKASGGWSGLPELIYDALQYEKPRQERVTEFLERYDLDASRIAEDGWNLYGHFEYTDEIEYEEVIPFANVSTLYPTGRARQWREWPEDFDFDGLVRAWNGS